MAYQKTKECSNHGPIRRAKSGDQQTMAVSEMPLRHVSCIPHLPIQLCFIKTHGGVCTHTRWGQSAVLPLRLTVGGQEARIMTAQTYPTDLLHRPTLQAYCTGQDNLAWLWPCVSCLLHLPTSSGPVVWQWQQIVLLVCKLLITISLAAS